RRPYSRPAAIAAGGGSLIARNATRSSLRRPAVVLGIIVAVVLLVPYAIVPLYRIVDPISMPMLWRFLTGGRVTRIAVPLSRISPALPLAVIVAEDGSFCRNHGIDLGAMREALAQQD